MFKVKIFTLYPEFFPGPFEKGIYGKAIEKKIWDMSVINIRDYAEDKHKTVDDTPYGGGSGTGPYSKKFSKRLAEWNAKTNQLGYLTGEYSERNFNIFSCH